MAHVVTGQSLTDALHKAVRFQLDHESPDAVLNIETHLYDVTVTARSCVYELDIGKELWLNRGRWSRLTKEYVPKEPLERFVAQGKEILAGLARQGATANMMFRDPDRYAKKHRWGGCLMGATFRGDNRKDAATLTFFSRTTYMGYMGLMDGALAAVMARLIAGDASKVRFRWVITSSQLHCFKTLPFVYSQPDLIDRLEYFTNLLKVDPRMCRQRMSPTWYHMSKWYAKVLEAHRTLGTVKMLEQEKYGPFRRIKRRWLEYKGHLKKAVPPSLKVDALDFGRAV